MPATVVAGILTFGCFDLDFTVAHPA